MSVKYCLKYGLTFLTSTKELVPRISSNLCPVVRGEHIFIFLHDLLSGSLLVIVWLWRRKIICTA